MLRHRIPYVLVLAGLAIGGLAGAALADGLPVPPLPTVPAVPSVPAVTVPTPVVTATVAVPTTPAVPAPAPPTTVVVPTPRPAAPAVAVRAPTITAPRPVAAPVAVLTPAHVVTSAPTPTPTPTPTPVVRTTRRAARVAASRTPRRPATVPYFQIVPCPPGRTVASVLAQIGRTGTHAGPAHASTPPTEPKPKPRPTPRSTLPIPHVARAAGVSIVRHPLRALELFLLAMLAAANAVLVSVRMRIGRVLHS